MKTKIITLLVIVLLTGIPNISTAKIPEGNRPYGMVEHRKNIKLVNRYKYFKRQHQNRIFQSYLRWNKRYKGKWGDSFAPAGQKWW